MRFCIKIYIYYFVLNTKKQGGDKIKFGEIKLKRCDGVDQILLNCLEGMTKIFEFQFKFEAKKGGGRERER